VPLAPISDVKAWALRQPQDRRAFVVVRIDTEIGVSGWGEASPGADPAATARAVEAARPHLAGRDAASAEAVRLHLSKSLAGSPREVASVQAAVSMALGDILGKLSKAPLYDVLGGATRTKVRALAALLGRTEAEWLDSLREARSAGFRAVAVPLSIPEGPVRGRGFYRRVRESLEKLRAAAEDVDFALDCGERVSGAEAAVLARELETFHLLWIEAPALPPRALADVGAESAAPVGHGRTLLEVADFQELLRDDAIDAARPDIALWGPAQVRKAAALAETYYVAVAPYHSGGPVATAAALQADASIPNFVLQEVPFPADDRDRKMRRELAGAELEAVKDGFLALPAGAGLGVAVDPDALARYRIAP
jgi:galactonate dehydratase